MLEIRNAVYEDVPVLMALYDHARNIMRDSGNHTQWTNGYPQEALVRKDIENGSVYVLCEDKSIHMVFTLIVGDDPTYKTIYHGKWLNEAPYGTIHRIASAGTHKGSAEYIIKWCLEKCGNIRIDTHADNTIMQHVLEKNDFQKCGTIYVTDGTPRIAYQKTK